MNSKKNRGTGYLPFFIAFLLLAALACNALSRNEDSEPAFEEAATEPGPAEDAADSSELVEESVVGEEIPEEDVEESDQDAASETASETESGTTPDSEEEASELDSKADEDTSADLETPESTEEPDESSGELEAPSEISQLVLGDFGFVQEPELTEVAYAFHLENPNAEYGIQDSEYQIAIYDDSGSILETDSGFISLILPSEKTAIGSSIWLDEGSRAAKIEVQIKSGDPVTLESVPALSTTTPRFFDEEYSNRITGILESQYTEYMKDIVVTIVAYDSQRNIVGTGYTYVDWIDPGESTGIEAYVSIDGEVDSIEMFPRVSYYSLDPSQGILPEGASDFELIDVGHYRDEDGVTFGLITQNPNPNFAIEDARYSATGYANDGSVLFVDRGYLDLILPGEQMVAGRFVYLDTDEEVAQIDYRIRAGDFVETEPIPQFGSSNISFLADDFSPTVTGEVENPFGWDLEDVRVWAVLYDEANNIVGSGYDFVDFIPANGSAAAEIYVDGHPNPTRIEIFPAVSYFDEVLGPPE